MEQYVKLAELLKGKPKQRGGDGLLFTGLVKSVSGETCTVVVDGLEVPDVRLKATVNEGANYLLITPKTNTSVVLGSLSGDLSDLAVLAVDEAAKIEWKTSGLCLLLDGADNKMKLGNNAADLKGLLQDLVNLLKGLKVYTPAGPSSTPLPDSITAITAFETKFKTLLK